jgi:hypothetical protein
VLPVDPPPGAQRSHGVSNAVLATSAVLAGGGIVFHVLAFQTRGKLEDAADSDAYHANESTFDVQRGTTFALYGLAAIGAGVGIYLRTRENATAVQVGADVRADRALVTIGWHR